MRSRLAERNRSSDVDSLLRGLTGARFCVPQTAAPIYPAARPLRVTGLRFCRSIGACLLLCTFCIPVFGIDRDRRLDQLFHTSWTAKDGAPSEIRAIAQTTDGYLWLGSEIGLYRFDGVRFQRFQPLSGPLLPGSVVMSLLAVPDGGLWVGLSNGTVSLLQHGALKTYGSKEGLGTTVVRALARDHQGTIWAAGGSGGLFRLEGSRWKKVGGDEGFSGAPTSLFVNRDGTVWVGTVDSVFFLTAGQRRFRLAASGFEYVMSLAESSTATMWMANFSKAVTTVPLHGDTEVARPAIGFPSYAILFDDQGCLWATSHGEGLYRIPDPEKLDLIPHPEKRRPTDTYVSMYKSNRAQAENFTQLQGLSNDAITSIFQDREGNIWTGTASGLDRFRQSTFVPIPFPHGTVESSLTLQRNGSIQAASTNKPLLVIEDGRANEVPGEYVAIDGLRFPKGFGILLSYIAQPTTYMKSIADKDVVVGTPDRPQMILKTKLLARPQIYYAGTKGLVTARHSVGEIPSTVVQDSSGRWWFSLMGQGVFRAETHGWTTLESLGGPSGTATTSFTDASRRIWFGFADSKVAVVDGSNVHILSEKDGLTVGTVYAIHGNGSDIWVAGPNDLAFFDGIRFHTMIISSRQKLSLIRSLLVTSGEGLWLSTKDGILQIPESEVQSFHNDPRHPVELRAFDTADGIWSNVQAGGNGRNNGVLGNDGRIYFATLEGAVWADPKRISQNNLPPPVAVEDLIASGRTYTFYEPVKLAPRTTALRIQYAAMSLSIPERVRFRYKLDGVDQGWQDADTRRDAYYTNLSSGNYTFHVIACNDSGVWNQTGATASFAIAPTYYQTRWFESACGVMMLGFLWCLYMWRLRHVTAQIQERLGAQLEERERIARELHDTLLQGFQGLMLRFQAVMKTLPSDQPAHQMMEQVLDRADEVLFEGRQRVRDLREKGAAGLELPDALSHCGEELAVGHSSRFSLAVVGEMRSVDPVVFDEAYRIAREALINAFQHSKAAKVEVEVIYSRSGVCIRVRDDGMGMDATVLNRGRAGHWGLSGVRERAAKIGSQLNIWSKPGVGTELELTIPARVAHSNGKTRSLVQRIKQVVTQSKEARL